MIYSKIALKEGVPVQYVGVYVLHWRSDWGEPEVGFVEAEEAEVEFKRLASVLGRVQDERYILQQSLQKIYECGSIQEAERIAHEALNAIRTSL